MHASLCFWRLSISDTALLLKGRERLPLSVVGEPKDGAGDEAKVGMRGLLSEGYFPILEHVHGITDPPSSPSELGELCDGGSIRSRS
jgi:hypothetical protein